MCQGRRMLGSPSVVLVTLGNPVSSLDGGSTRRPRAPFRQLPRGRLCCTCVGAKARWPVSFGVSIHSPQPQPEEGGRRATWSPSGAFASSSIHKAVD